MPLPLYIGDGDQPVPTDQYPRLRAFLNAAQIQLPTLVAARGPALAMHLDEVSLHAAGSVDLAGYGTQYVVIPPTPDSVGGGEILLSEASARSIDNLLAGRLTRRAAVRAGQQLLLLCHELGHAIGPQDFAAFVRQYATTLAPEDALRVFQVAFDAHKAEPLEQRAAAARGLSEAVAQWSALHLCIPLLETTGMFNIDGVRRVMEDPRHPGDVNPSVLYLDYPEQTALFEGVVAHVAASGQSAADLYRDVVESGAGHAGLEVLARAVTSAGGQAYPAALESLEAAFQQATVRFEEAATKSGRGLSQALDTLRTGAPGRVERLMGALWLGGPAGPQSPGM